MRLRTGSALVQAMVVACSSASYYLNQWWVIVNWTIGYTFRWNMNLNCCSFIQENVVCEKAAILFTKRWVRNESYRKNRALIWESSRYTPYIYLKRHPIVSASDFGNVRGVVVCINFNDHRNQCGYFAAKQFIVSRYSDMQIYAMIISLYMYAIEYGINVWTGQFQQHVFERILRFA